MTSPASVAARGSACSSSRAQPQAALVVGERCRSRSIGAGGRRHGAGAGAARPAARPVFGRAGSLAFLCGCCASGQHQRAFLPASRHDCRQADKDHTATQLLMNISIPRVSARRSAGTSVARGLSHALQDQLVESLMNRSSGVCWRCLPWALSAPRLRRWRTIRSGLTSVLAWACPMSGTTITAHITTAITATIRQQCRVEGDGRHAAAAHHRRRSSSTSTSAAPTATDGYYNNYYYFGPNSHPKATLLYGVGYLPLPLPFLDVYGKLGVARLQTDIPASPTRLAMELRSPVLPFPTASISRTTSSPTVPECRRNSRISRSAPNMRASVRSTATPPPSR